MIPISKTTTRDGKRENMTLSKAIPSETESKNKDITFQAAYNHAMKVLDGVIRKYQREANGGDQNISKLIHSASKAQFMQTAKRTIEENIKMYLEHPELFKEE